MNVVRKTPLIAMDLLIINDAGKALFGYRRNAPARNTWFVPGGRIYKNEWFEVAFERIARTEVGANFALHGAVFKGVFEHFYAGNFAAAAGIDTHYVTLAYQVRVPSDWNVELPKLQHSAYRWISVNDVAEVPEVHPYARAYFQRP